MSDQIAIAFLPLTDSAVLIAAREKGFAADFDIDLLLVRDMSWATVRDRLVYGQVQAAHLLAPLALGVSLGMSQHPAAISAPFKLGLNGNALTLSPELAGWLDSDPLRRVNDPAAAAHAFAAGLKRRAKPPVLGIVHRFSGHALMLRYWLAYAGIDPDRDLSLRVLPPPLMAGALASGEIDGFCAGEPWGSVAVARGIGEIGAIGAKIWRRGVEKVLGVREDWADANPELLDRLLRALDRAAAWCDAPENHAELANILARAQYVGQPAALIEQGLSGRLLLSAAGATCDISDFMLLHSEAANFPWRSQALWIYAQFVRWGMVQDDVAMRDKAARVFRPDIYRRALAGGVTPMPGASAKLEGAIERPLPVGSNLGTLTLGPDRFFDGRIFDPDQIETYLAGFARLGG